MTTRPRFLPRLRVALAVLVLTATSVAWNAAPPPQGAPGEPPAAPLPFGLGPQAALAAYCATPNPAFTGRLTANSSSTTAVSRITTASLAGYISNVDDDWACTAFLRYDGVAWNTTATTGNYSWGNLINSTSVGCNWVIGSTDYVKANSTTDCPDSDAEYAMTVTLDGQGTFQADSAHNSDGDFSFVHSDCSTYYGSLVSLAGKSFVTTNTDNRPGANCDAITLDSTGTAQTITYDSAAPTIDFTTPNESTTAYRTATSSYTVTFSATDALAGFGGANGWSLQRQITTMTTGTCGAFANDPAAGNLTTGTTSGTSNIGQALVSGKCYRWLLNATDQNGNTASQHTSGMIKQDSGTPATDFTTPNEGTTTNLNTTPYSVAWVETEPGSSGITSRSLQRKRAAWTSGSCAGLTFTNDGSAVTSVAPVSAALTSGYCYYWTQTLIDAAGNQSATNSGYVTYNAANPSPNFTTPNEGTTAAQTSTSYSVAWTESAGSGQTITGRSLQRQRALVVTPGTCVGLTFTNDGSASTAVSPVNVTGLLNGYAYRWIETLTNSAGKTGSSTSGCVIIDTTAPSGAIAFPETNRPLAGNVQITGSATDATSFKEYQLEYGGGGAPGTWTQIGTFTTQVAGTGSLATWSTGALTGVYTLRLTVRDLAGNTNSVTTRLVYIENSRRGEEAYRTRVPFDLGGGYRLGVGVANGEATLTRDLFTIPSYGPPQALSLTYSSAETSTAGGFGGGWISNLTQYLTFESGFVVWHRADGGRVPFGSVGGSWTPLAGHHETLTAGSGTYIVTLIDQTKLTFASSGAGALQTIQDRFGQALTLAWGTTSTATDASGRATTLVVANGRISDATDSAGRHWGFAYTGTDLTTITDPAGKTTTLAYDGSHRLTSVTRTRTPAAGSPETLVWRVGYGTGGVTSVIDPLGDLQSPTKAPTEFTYGAGTTTVERLREYGQPVGGDWTSDDSTYAFDDLGRVTATAQVIDPTAEPPLVATTTYGFDAASNLASVTRPIDAATSATTTSTYDAAGNVLTETQPLSDTSSVVTVMTYNTTKDLVTRTDADNDAATRTVTKYGYDASGHLTSVNINCTTSGTTPPGQGQGSTCTGAGTQDAATNLITTYTYTANHQLETETDPLGRVTKHAYDTYGPAGATYGLEVSTTQNYVSGQSATADRNVLTVWTFDQGTTAGKAGLATSTTDPKGETTTYTYDALGRQLTEILPGDASIPALTRTSTYDELGNVLTESENWSGLASPRVTTHVYDLVNRETRVTDPAGVVSDTSFDAAGNATGASSGGVETERTFDGVGQVIIETVVNADTGDAITTSTYDLGGREIQTQNPAGEITDRTYDLAGRLESETQYPEGLPLATTHAYDALGREVASDAPDGTTTTGYDRVGRVTSSTVNGVSASYAYDRAGNQTSQTDAAGIVTTTTYDALSRPTTVVGNDVASPTLPSEDVTTVTYHDPAGNVVATKDPKGVVARTFVNARGLAETTIANCTNTGTTPPSDPATCAGTGTSDATTNLEATTTYDGSGATLIRIEATGSTTTAAYDAAGRQQAVKDPRGTVTRTLYTTDGQVSATIVNCTPDTTNPQPPSGSWWTCSGSSLHDGTWNVVTAYAYDSQGRTTSETAPNGRVTSYQYDEADRLVGRIDNDVATPTQADQDLATTFFYDDAGRNVAVLRPTTDRMTLVADRTIYNADGRVAAQIQNCTNTGEGTTVPANPATCDGGGTANAETNVTTTFAYDTAGNRVRVDEPDPAGGAAPITTRFAFDATNRLCRVLQSATVDLQALANPCSSTVTGQTATLNVLTSYGYDDVGNLVSMTDARGKLTAYGFDAASRMTSLTDPEAATLYYNYDALGRRTSQENRSDPPQTNSVAWTYDEAGRVLTRAANGVTVTTTYDDNGNRLTVGDGTRTITTTYDRLNRPLTVSISGDSGAGTTYTYSLTSPTWTDPTGSYSATLDKFDRQVTLVDPIHGASTFDWTYRADGQAASVAAPNGNTTAYGYNAIGRATSKVTTAAGPVTRASYGWTLNAAGQVSAESSTITGDPTNGTTSYTYDPLARLASYTRGGTTTAYGWQSVPNRDSVQVGADPATTYTFDDANRLTADSAGGAYTADADGRMTARPGYRHEWDALGRLTKVKPPTGGSTMATYTYDPLDRLLVADYGGSNRLRFRYVGQTTSIAQVVNDQSGSVIRSIGNDWTGEHLLDWTGSGSNQRFYGTNGHHDLTWTADASGVVNATLRYDPWGTLTSSSGSSLPDFRFQGSWSDANTELSWVITRWYAPSLGRFTSEDSLLGDPADPPSRHLYAYAAGEPIGRWDPDGRETWRLVHSTSVVLTLDQARALNFNAGFWRAVWLFSAGLLVAPLGFGAALLYGGTSALGSLAISVLSDGYQAYDKINAYIYKSDLGRYKTITYTYDYHALSTGPGYERISNTIRIYGNGPMCTSANLMAYNDPYRYGAALAQCGMVVYAYSWKRNHFPY